METIDDEVKSDNSERKDETLQDVQNYIKLLCITVSANNNQHQPSIL